MVYNDKMFVSQDKTPKKKNQKPNILRKKGNKVQLSQINKFDEIETSNLKSLTNSTQELEKNNHRKDLNLISVCCKRSKSIVPMKEIVKPLNINGEINLGNYDEGSADDVSSILRDRVLAVKNDIHFKYLNKKQSNQPLNVETFITQERVKQVPFAEDVIIPKGNNTQGNQKLMEFINDSQNITIEKCDRPIVNTKYTKSAPDMPCVVVPFSTISFATPQVQNFELMNKEVPSGVNIQNIFIDDAMEHAVFFRCDVSNCNEVFSTEQKLTKHRSLHNKDGSLRPPRQTTVECPVKKVCPNGVEERCEKIFNVREELIKHLNEDHSPDDAAYKCVECGRRFFWAPGLRAHARAHGARRRVLACGWPGCGRVFRQPCRLREHTRAHTGDRPYPCRHPNCGWSFRTASKLLRHARRHTGERRHACAVCGRAFLRREHLRDHTARHHAPHPRRAHACPAPDCQQTFTNMSSLYTHMKKVHKKEQNYTTAVEPLIDNQLPSKAEPAENMFMLSLLDAEQTECELETVGVEAEAEVEVEVGAGVEGHAARTHCTWPLARALACTRDSYVLEEDAQVEQTEGVENNIYTVRSDLFLHGNVMHNEDSEPGGVGVGVGVGVGTARVGVDGGLAGLSGSSLDADLLLDAPSVDIAQEELYTDAVDESSFRVFLLSGEDLS